MAFNAAELGKAQHLIIARLCNLASSAVSGAAWKCSWCTVLLDGCAGLLWEPKCACMPKVWLLASPGAVQGASRQESPGWYGLPTGTIYTPTFLHTNQIAVQTAT